MSALKFIDLGTKDYLETLKIQKKLFEQNIAAKLSGEPTENYVIFVEHPHVFTLGKHGKKANLLITEQKLEQLNAKFVLTDRGGDITYHGFGQQVVYPIINLAHFHILTKKYVWALEEIIIRMLKEYQIEAQRLEGAPGIWLTFNRQLPEKICAIGIRVRHDITMHGIALNVNTDLSYFSYINPCGFTDKGVTSIEKELGNKVDMKEIKEKLRLYFNQIFSEFLDKKQ